jgi:hypothetical protein
VGGGGFGLALVESIDLLVARPLDFARSAAVPHLTWAAGTLLALALATAGFPLAWAADRLFGIGAGLARLRSDPLARTRLLAALLLGDLVLMAFHQISLRAATKIHLLHVTWDRQNILFGALPVAFVPAVLLGWLIPGVLLDRLIRRRRGPGVASWLFWVGVVGAVLVAPAIYVNAVVPAWIFEELNMETRAPDLRPTVVAAAIVLLGVGIGGVFGISRERFRRIAWIGAALAAGNLMMAHVTIAGSEADRHLLVHRTLLSGTVWRTLYAATDFDGDGTSGGFGGGDPAPFDAGAGSYTQVSAEPAPVAPPGGAQTPILLITIDALRRDALGRAGLTPNIEAAFSDAIVYERCSAYSSGTALSVGALLRGGDPRSPRPTIASRLAQAGYATLMVTSTVVLSDPIFTEGFERVRNLTTGDRLRDRQVAHSAAMTDILIAEIARRPRDRPLFLWTHYTDPHGHYLPHEGAPIAGEDSFSRYLQEVWFTDKHLGRLFEALKQEGLWDRAVVILTGDHGEAFGEHGDTSHGQTLYDEVIAVPLLIRIPGRAPERRSETFSLLDLEPLIMRMTGGLSADPFEGAPRTAVSVLYGPARERLGAVMDGPWKLIVHRDTFCRELYDRASDPGETRNLIDAEPARAAELLRAFLRRCGSSW